MSGKKRCLIVFAKEPKKWKVKTKLTEHLPKQLCIELYEAFLKDTISLARRISAEEKIIAYDSTGAPQYLKKNARRFTFYKQRGKDRGARMHEAFLFAKRRGADKMVIIGSESPNLPFDVVRKAFVELENNDLVLGESFDGGYYAIGLKDPSSELFKNIKWNSNSALKQTIENAGKLRKKTALLNRWYDVDDINSLEFLKNDLDKKRAVTSTTKKVLKNHSLL